MKVTHGVTSGAVFCPEQGRVVDVMSCYACAKVILIDLDSRHPKVVCAVPAPGEPAAAS